MVKKHQRKLDLHTHELMREIYNSKRNWDDEGGTYLCECKICKKNFFGHKYRWLCKECYTKIERENNE